MMGAKFKKSLLGGLFLGLAAMLIVTSPVLAVETTKWDVLKGDWDNPDNWTNGVPLKNYDVFIDIPGAVVTYLNSSNPTLRSLLLDPSDPQKGEVALTQAQDILTVKNTEIGSKGTAIYNLNGGTHKVLQDLTLGTAADGEGIYNIMGGFLSVGGHETLGLAGKGYLLQLGLGNSLSSESPPSLGCTPPVPPPPPVGPTHSVGKNLYLGFESSSDDEVDFDGEINLVNSSLTVGGSTRVGIRGTGLFQQTDSIVKIKGNHYEDPDNMSGSPSTVGEGALSYSPNFSALSKKNLKNNKLECVSSRESGLIVGLENEGQYDLKGGSLNVNYSEVIGLANGGKGQFNQTDGTHNINGNLYLGKGKDSFGNFNLYVNRPQTDPPTPPGVALLDVHGFASVGYLGEGNFFQNGGTVNVMGIDQEVNQKGKSLSNTLSKGSSLSCSQHQYIGFTVGRGGIGSYFLHDGELVVSHGEIIGMISGSDGTFTQVGGNHFIGGDLTLARDPGSKGSKGSKGLYTLSDGTLKVHGSLLNNVGGTFDYYGGELQANVINKGTFTAYGPGERTFPNQFFNYGTFEIIGQPSGTASFAQKFRNYGVYKSTVMAGNTTGTSGKIAGTPSAESRFTYLYIVSEGYIDAGADNYYITKEFNNTSTLKEKSKWKTDMANLIFTGPGRKPFKAGSAHKESDGFVDNFAWGSVGIEGNGSVQLLDVLYAHEIGGLKVNPQNKRITNLFGTCGTRIYYDNISFDYSLDEYILMNGYGKQVGHFTAAGYATDCK